MLSFVRAQMLSMSLLSITAPAQSVGSAFAADHDGWTVANSNYAGHIVLPPSSTTLPAWDGANGLPPGSIRIGDVFAETSIRAPAAFCGDKLGWFGGSVSWDIYIRFTDGVTYPAVWLVGATKTLVYNTPSPPLDVWHHVDVPLLETGWRVNGWQGVAATRGELMEVLADLRAILINTEWRTGPDDTNVDNVVLAAPTGGARCYGAACRGSNGRWPTTWLTGTVSSGGSVALQATDGVPGSLAVVVVGTGPANVVLFDCTAWIAPTDTNFPLILDASGAASMNATVPVAPIGPFCVLQSVFFDATAQNGYGIVFSNAVAVSVQ